MVNTFSFKHCLCIYLIKNSTVKSFIFVFSVAVSFDPTSYTVTEGDDGFAVLTLVRSGDLSRATVVTVNTADDSATGMEYKLKFSSDI